jgi:YbbR domain-containing protein
VAPQIKGAGDHQVTLSPSAVQVTLTGPMPLLTQLRPQDVQVTVDVSNAPVGQQKIKPAVSAPSLLKLVGSSPYDIAVTIK